jgi:hypothetical protein
MTTTATKHIAIVHIKEYDSPAWVYSVGTFDSKEAAEKAAADYEDYSGEKINFYAEPVEMPVPSKPKSNIPQWKIKGLSKARQMDRFESFDLYGANSRAGSYVAALSRSGLIEAVGAGAWGCNIYEITHKGLKFLKENLA